MQVVMVLKKEIMKTQNKELEKAAEYRHLLVHAIHECAANFPDIAANVIHLLMDFLVCSLSLWLIACIGRSHQSSPLSLSSWTGTPYVCISMSFEKCPSKALSLVRLGGLDQDKSRIQSAVTHPTREVSTGSQSHSGVG